MEVTDDADTADEHGAIGTGAGAMGVKLARRPSLLRDPGPKRNG